MDDVALFGHLLGAFAFVSGVVVAGVGFESARRRSDPAEIALLLGLARIGVAVAAPGMVLVLAFGLWLVHLGDFGGAGWLDAAFLLFIAAVVLGALGGRTPRQARLLASRLAADGQPAGDELRRLLDDPRARLANYASGLLVLVILVLMVWKPGGPT